MTRSYLHLLAASTLLVTVQPAAAQRGDSGTLVVVNKGAGTASLVDLASQRIVATLPTGNGPHEIAITRDGRTTVVTDYGGRPGGNTLTVIDVPGRVVARTIDLGRYRRPHGIAFLPGDSLVAVTSEAAGHIVIVRVADGGIVRTLSTTQGGSHMLALVGDGRTIYTSNGRDDSVSDIDLSGVRQTTSFPVPARPEAITVTEDGSEVWVGSNADGTVSIVDTEDRSIEEVARGFGWPYRILITPDNRLAIIPDLRRNELRILDRASHRELAVLNLPGSGPQGVTLSGDGKTLYLALSRQDRVAIIDLETQEITGYLPTGSRPDGVAYSPLVLTN